MKRRELEDLLAEHDMPVEKKTLYQDFAALGDVCGLQLEYDVHKKGYRLLNPPFEPYDIFLILPSAKRMRSPVLTVEQKRTPKSELRSSFGAASQI